MQGKLTVATTLLIVASSATIDAQYEIGGEPARVEPFANPGSSQQGSVDVHPPQSPRAVARGLPWIWQGPTGHTKGRVRIYEIENA
jgi:hypothetical protein